MEDEDPQWALTAPASPGKTAVKKGHGGSSKL